MLRVQKAQNFGTPIAKVPKNSIPTSKKSPENKTCVLTQVSPKNLRFRDAVATGTYVQYKCRACKLAKLRYPPAKSSLKYYLFPAHTLPENIACIYSSAINFCAF